MHASSIEALPHQITAVYGEMLPRQPLRFLLADNPWAGKTIMAAHELVPGEALADLLRNPLSGLAYASGVDRGGLHVPLAAAEAQVRSPHPTRRQLRGSSRRPRQALRARKRRRSASRPPGAQALLRQRRAEPAAAHPQTPTHHRQRHQRIQAARRPRVTLRLEIETPAPDGFSTEDAAVIRGKAGSLKFSADGTGFSD